MTLLLRSTQKSNIIGILVRIPNSDKKKTVKRLGKKSRLWINKDLECKAESCSLERDAQAAHINYHYSNV